MSEGNDYQKPCKNCKRTITMSQRSGKWAAYEVDNSLHRCQQSQEQKAHVVEQMYNHEAPQVIEVKEHPNKVPRPTTAMYAIIEHESKKEALKKLTEFVNKYLSYGGQTYGVTYHLDPSDNYTQFFVSYAIPNNAVGEMGND